MSLSQSEIMQQFKFHTRSRKQNETVVEFVSGLRAIAKDCNFGTREQLELMLRDRLVCGIANEKIQSKLLSEKTLTYANALSMAQSMEIAQKNVRELQGAGTGEPTNPNINTVDTKPSDPAISVVRKATRLQPAGSRMSPVTSAENRDT
jgi:hypothetical protein